ncbi:hypothetical protein C8F01DRAFT_1254823 [Mycena amicta]|nr:hypothetical protein C8F01DRAFT_1254823 [Mycena amicta]
MLILPGTLSIRRPQLQRRKHLHPRTASPLTAPLAAKIPFAPQDSPAFDAEPSIVPQATSEREPTSAFPPTIQRKKRTREDKRYRRGKKIHVEVEEKGRNAKRKRA